MRCEVSRDQGKTWNPLGNVRITPGGLDQGQTDLSASGKIALSSSGSTTVQLGTVAAGKTRWISELSFDIGSSSCDVSIQAGGVTIWQRFLQTALGIMEVRRRPLSVPAGVAVTLVFGTVATGTPNGYYNLGQWEE